MNKESVFTSVSPLEDLLSKYEDQAAQETDDVVLAHEPSRNDRRWSRGNVPEAHRGCELKIGDEVFPARLVNKSADGFGVLVTCPDRPSVGQVVQLHTSAGWLPIRVVYAARAKDAEPEEPNRGPCFRLGCSRRLKRSLLSWLWGR
jgi:hypothetical protein